MAKDPAVLFYTSDFLSGTAFFSDAEKGIYITLLCEQHQLWSIPESHLINRCGSINSPIVKKFIRDTDGTWYNDRMRKESIKRKIFCESRRESVSKRYNKSTCVDSYVAHTNIRMENENENRNEDINTLKKGDARGKQEYSSEVINIYNLYPAVDTNNNNRSTGKGSKDKDKIARMIKDIGYDQLKTRIENYLQNCNRSKEWLKNFSVLLNNLPEIVEMKNLPRKAMPCTL